MTAIVLGMHRSGTSALARLLNVAGLAFGLPEAAMPADVKMPLAHDVTRFITTDLHRHHWRRPDLADCPRVRLFMAIDASASEATAIPVSLSADSAATLTRHATAHRAPVGADASRDLASA